MTLHDHQHPSDHPPRWQRRKDARPTEILAAALAEFVEHGYAATKLEDVWGGVIQFVAPGETTVMIP